MGLNEIGRELTRIMKEYPERALKVLQIEGRRSIDKNFEEGGRPRWIPSQKIRSKKVRTRRGNKTLIDSGKLRRVRVAIESNRVVIFPDPLTRAYAQIHQDGVEYVREARTRKRNVRNKRYARDSRKRGVEEVRIKSHRVVIPARPFMTIPEEDYGRILSAVGKSLRA